MWKGVSLVKTVWYVFPKCFPKWPRLPAYPATSSKWESALGDSRQHFQTFTNLTGDHFYLHFCIYYCEACLFLNCGKSGMREAPNTRLSLHTILFIISTVFWIFWTFYHVALSLYTPRVVIPFCCLPLALGKHPSLFRMDGSDCSRCLT